MKHVTLITTLAVIAASHAQAGGLDGAVIGIGIANTLINAAQAARRPQTVVVERTVVVHDRKPVHHEVKQHTTQPVAHVGSGSTHYND